ncbi:hypothetical protein RRG08_024489 [Elysia crispata]|uniref:Uncharacterized protein n=1 Tax=Elysia crispata TaxID=231223 RepID=A0AAE0YP61_9GAST|nr:hypothetical protein RRG08_024489 [Elysia crispata]
MSIEVILNTLFACKKPSLIRPASGFPRLTICKALTLVLSCRGPSPPLQTLSCSPVLYTLFVLARAGELREPGGGGVCERYPHVISSEVIGA